jgi:hypothetical protein
MDMAGGEQHKKILHNKNEQHLKIFPTAFYPLIDQLYEQHPQGLEIFLSSTTSPSKFSNFSTSANPKNHYKNE